MIPRACKRLTEVDFPIADVSRHAARALRVRPLGARASRPESAIPRARCSRSQAFEFHQASAGFNVVFRMAGYARG